jgi:D-alanyl-lipoteichoic acid acyltransferase DltB (MBOAT superfamily)
VFAKAGHALPSVGEAWTGALAFPFQIYFDFSGYSDMAIGLALLFGFVLRANFDVPYRAASLREFWRRWHMTLSRFLRDYLYIPFGGNRDGLERQLAGLLATMTLADCGTAPVGPSSPGARCTGSASPPACCGAGASPRFPRPSAGRS